VPFFLPSLSKTAFHPFPFNRYHFLRAPAMTPWLLGQIPPIAWSWNIGKVRIYIYLSDFA
jgi:hypothetical protein